jgi:uncharacterized protein (DUF1778 family)
MQRGNPRIDFRVTPEAKQRIENCATERSVPVADFVRQLVLDSIAHHGELPSNAEMQLTAMAERLDEIAELLKSIHLLARRVERLSGAGVASSAIAAFAQLDGEAYQAGVRAHIEASIDGGAHVLKLLLASGAAVATTNGDARG